MAALRMWSDVQVHTSEWAMHAAYLGAQRLLQQFAGAGGAQLYAAQCSIARGEWTAAATQSGRGGSALQLKLLKKFV